MQNEWIVEGREEKKERTNGSEGEVVKDLSAIFPRVCVCIFLLALVIEAVNLRYLSALVVTSQQRYFVGETRFQDKKICERFQTVVPSVHKISLLSLLLLYFLFILNIK